MIVFWPGQRHTPKLGLDLEGGFQVIFTAKAPNGQTPSSQSMDQAKQIMEERVNGSGVTEATVVVQGSDQIVISIPGGTTTDVSKLGAAAVLNFRGLVAPSVALACAVPHTSPSGSSAPSGSTAPSGSARPSTPANSQPSPHTTQDATSRRLGAPRAAPTSPVPSPSPTAGSASATPSGSASPGASPSAAASTAPAVPCTATPFAALEQAGVKIPTTEAAYQKLPATAQQQVQAALATFDCASGQQEKDQPQNYFVACDETGTQAYLLGTVIVPGHEIDTASAVPPNFSQGGSSQWTVSLELKPGGQKSWGAYTTAHNIGGGDANSAGSTSTCGPSGTACADYVGFTLDGIVVSIPVNISAINGGATQISGSFTQSSANDLANKLKYGALPLSFTPSQAESVSPTLGSSQLRAGLLAGGIGLALVVIYSLIYYRALGLVTIASLVVSGVLVYGSLVMLGTQIGFTLSLAGIAGFIVAVGITADSFVVFFERIKDEVHEGRSARVAIPRAWVRARRTILSADTVSFLAAAILYYFAAGDVKGFAFTLGLSTILDLVVVFLFTHPLVSYLSRFPAFGSKRFTGLDAVREPAPAAAARRVRVGAAVRGGGVGTVTLGGPQDDDGAAADADESDADETGADVPDRGAPP
ncbi:MAG: protein translocase subunit SecD, partial [Jatrophihabitans sp.]